MASITQARDITLRELQSQFNLQTSSRDDFFDEWKKSPVNLTEIEQGQLKRLQQNYKNLSEYRNFSEESVKVERDDELTQVLGVLKYIRQVVVTE